MRKIKGYAYFTDKDGNILSPNYLKGDEEE
jgi:hypothetical protein